MIIHYFHIKGIVSIPFKANPPLIVDPDTVLAFSVSGQYLQVIISVRSLGGTLKSSIHTDRFSIHSFFNAERWMFCGSFLEKSLENIFSVSLHLNDLIMDN